MPERKEPRPEILRAEGLVKDYLVPKKSGWFGSDKTRAVDGVSLSIQEGETLAVVGESGSGKSTLGRLLLGLEPPDEGRVLFEGRELKSLPSAELRAARGRLQMVFQDPYASLDPRWKAVDIVTEALAAQQKLSGDQKEEAARRLLAEVGLDPAWTSRYPHQFSGGQRQRLAIARAVATRPRLLIADEPVSALDLELQAQILDLLRRLRSQLNLTVVFITHDLRLVRGFGERMVVMLGGKIVEGGDVAKVWQDPRHPFTRELLASVLPLPVKRKA